MGADFYIERSIHVFRTDGDSNVILLPVIRGYYCSEFIESFNRTNPYEDAYVMQCWHDYQKAVLKPVDVIVMYEGRMWKATTPYDDLVRDLNLAEVERIELHETRREV
jgi:hypothetical protein